MARRRAVGRRFARGRRVQQCRPVSSGCRRHDQSPHRRRPRRNVWRCSAGGIPRAAIRSVSRRRGGDGRPLRRRRHDHVRHRIARSHARRCAAAEMDSVAGDRGRSFPALSSAQARGSHHQRSRHPRRADARAGRLYDDGGEPRRHTPGRGLSASHLGAAAVEHAARQDCRDRRHRHRRRGDRRAAPGIRHACRRRQPHAADGKGLRRNHADGSLARRRKEGRLPHQRPAGGASQFVAVRCRRIRRDEAVRLLHQRRPRPDRRRGRADRSVTRAPHRRRRA